MKYSFLALSFVLGFSSLGNDKIDWKPCEKEIKEYSCKGDDKAIWECLEKHDDKLSASCQTAHAKADAKFKH